MVEVHWLLFTVASLVLIVTPGQDMVLVMSRSVAQGAAAGVATAAGVSVGLVGHTLLATLGLGAVLRTSEWLFMRSSSQVRRISSISVSAYCAPRVWRSCYRPLRGACATDVGWRVIQRLQPQDRHLLLRFSASVRASGRRATHAVGVCARAIVRCAHLSGQGTSRLLRRLVVRLATPAPRRPRLALSIERCHSYRPWCRACVRASSMKRGQTATSSNRCIASAAR